MTEDEAFQAWYAADLFWSAELQIRFGKRAGDVRYTKEGYGEVGSILRAKHDTYVAARDAWYAIRDARKQEG